jgi:transposase
MVMSQRSLKMSRKKRSKILARRQYDDDFKKEAVQMLLDGHSAQSIVERLGISGTNLLYRWKKQQLAAAGVVGEVLDSRVQELEGELRRTQRERDVLKKALIIFGRNE